LPRNSTRTIRTADLKMGEVKPLNAMAQITVQVVHNPNLIDLQSWVSPADPNDASHPERNLIVEGNGAKIHLDIFTYPAIIGRPQ
jgi:hypothetical protein